MTLVPDIDLFQQEYDLQESQDQAGEYYRQE